MIGRIAVLLFAIASGFVTAAPALAAKRVALVIGIERYEHLSRLNNPVSDTKAIAALLVRNGFEVTRQLDPTYAELVLAVANFENEAQGADLALVYYAGHGMHLHGTDVLAPRDMPQRCLTDMSENSVRDALRGTVALNKILAAIQGARQKVVLIDACRNQPFPSCPARGDGDAGSGGGFRALGRLDARGVLIASSALPGSLAQDGVSGTHSPFASALLRRLDERPRAYFRDVLELVAEDVQTATHNTQEPHIQSLGGLTRACLATEGCGAEPSGSAEVDALRGELARLRAQPAAAAPAPDTGEIDRLRAEVERMRAAASAARERPMPTPKPREEDRDERQAMLRPDPPASSDGPARPRASGERCDKAGGVTVCGSSVLGAQFGNSYRPRNLMDGNDNTAWVEGASGDGRGQWIVIEFPGERQISQVVISNGYGKNGDIFSKNGRVREAELVFSSGSRIGVQLEDHSSPQTVRLRSPISARWVQLRVVSVYGGWKYKDLAINEIGFR